MTYDDAGGAYYGALAAVDGATLTLANDAWPASDWEMGEHSSVTGCCATGGGGPSEVGKQPALPQRGAALTRPSSRLARTRTRSLAGAWLGSQVYVINGTGASQIGRVLQPGVNTTTSPTNRTWVLAAPFAVTPDVGPGGSFVQLMPFRGRNIFFRDYNVDTGPHQFYGHGVESIVSEVKFERVRGLIGEHTTAQAPGRLRRGINGAPALPPLW